MPRLPDNLGGRQRAQGALCTIKIQGIFKLLPANSTPRSFERQEGATFIPLVRTDANTNAQPVDTAEVSLDDAA